RAAKPGHGSDKIGAGAFHTADDEACARRKSVGREEGVVESSQAGGQEYAQDEGSEQHPVPQASPRISWRCARGDQGAACRSRQGHEPWADFVAGSRHHFVSCGSNGWLSRFIGWLCGRKRRRGAASAVKRWRSDGAFAARISSMILSGVV